MIGYHNDRTRLPLSWFLMVGIIATIGVSLATSYDAPLRSNVPQVCITKGC